MKIKGYVNSAVGYLRWHAISAGLFNGMDDERYLKMIFKSVMGKPLNLENPVTFNEKLQWLKLHDRREEYTDMVDKYEVKKLVADKIGSEYVIESLGVWNDADEIDFDALPEQFVLKCTHDSGSVVVCKNKAELDIPAVRKRLNEGLKHNYYNSYREWPYKNVKPKILAEKYMGEELTDYKLMCFGGKPECLFTCTERFSPNGLKVTFFDTDWNRLPFERHYPASGKEIKKPEKLGEMLSIAQRLAEGTRFVRVDLYEIGGRIYFGELTFYPGSGLEEFRPAEWDAKLGELLKL